MGGWTGRVEGNWPAVPLTLSARTKGLVYIAVLPLLSLKPSTLPQAARVLHKRRRVRAQGALGTRGGYLVAASID